jgi:hypothetical protein
MKEFSMMKKIALTTAAAIAPVAMAVPAHAMGSGYDGDTRHCVTHREVWILGNADLTRPQVETRWEVTGLGWQVYIPGIGNAWAYQVCDAPTEWAFAQFSSGTLRVVGLVQNV